MTEHLRTGLPAPVAGYRSSHLEKGREYHEKFVSGPYRSILWAIERTALLEIFRSWRPNGRIRHLDFACGTGRILGLFAPHVDRSVGVDVSRSMLEVAREESPDADLRLVDLTRDPAFPEGFFDLITAFRFFPNAEPELRDEAMRVLSRLLAPGGLMIVNNHLRGEGTKMRCRPTWPSLRRGAATTGRHCMRDAEMEALVGRHGLVVRGTRTFGVLPVKSEKRPGLPKAWLRWIEHQALRFEGVRSLGNLRIYSLEHAKPGIRKDRGGDSSCSSS